MRPCRCNATARSSNVRRSTCQRYISRRFFSFSPSGGSLSGSELPSPMYLRRSLTSVGGERYVFRHANETDATDLPDAGFGVLDGGARCRDPPFASDREDVRHGFVDAFDAGHRSLAVVAAKLVLDVDQSSGIDHEVGGIEDAEVAKLVAVLLARQLVVRSAGDDLATELRDRVVVDDPSERTRSEHVD